MWACDDLMVPGARRTWMEVNEELKDLPAATLETVLSDVTSRMKQYALNSEPENGLKPKPLKCIFIEQ